MRRFLQILGDCFPLILLLALLLQVIDVILALRAAGVF